MREHGRVFETRCGPLRAIFHQYRTVAGILSKTHIYLVAVNPRLVGLPRVNGAVRPRIVSR